jgi:hypothetical protein
MNEKECHHWLENPERATEVGHIPTIHEVNEPSTTDPTMHRNKEQE